MRVSAYRNAKDNKGAVTEMKIVLKNIRDGKYAREIGMLRDMSKEEYDDQKKEILPGVTFSGVFQPKRQIDNCTSYNNIVTIDIDHLSDEQIMEYTDLLKKDKHVLSYFISPSGEGLKVLVRVSSDKEHHYDAFKCLELYFQTFYGITIDPSGKDPCRLCFVSYDPELYYNGSAQPFPVEISDEARTRVYADRSTAYGTFSVTDDDREKFKVCREWAQFYKPYEEGNRNNHIHKLACDLNRCGVSKDNATLLILRDYTDLPVGEIRDCVKNAYNNKDQFNTISIYDFSNEQDGMRGAMEFSTLGDMIDDVINMPTSGAVQTGFEKRDALLGGGMFRGSVYGYVGREKSFKSVDAIQTAIQVAKNGGVSLYLNGEMSIKQFLMIVAQQELGIRRSEFDANIQMVANYVKTTLKNLCVVSGSDFTEDGVIKTCESIRLKMKREVDLLILDGLTQMRWPTKDEITSNIANSIKCKEIAKKCNNGAGVPLIVLIHTNSQSQPWNRGPQAFVRGGQKVMANMDASIGFSRFIDPASITDGESAVQYRNDVYHVRVEDYRMTGEKDNLVMHVSPGYVKPVETTDDPILYEVKQDKKEKW